MCRYLPGVNVDNSTKANENIHFPVRRSNDFQAQNSKRLLVEARRRCYIFLLRRQLYFHLMETCMIGTREKENAFITEKSDYDFDLGLAGFKFSDLYDAGKLKEIAEIFYAEVQTKEPILHEALTKYVRARGQGYEKRVESKILTDAAPHLSEFVARLFNVVAERENLLRVINEQDPIWSYKFFVQRRAFKKY